MENSHIQINEFRQENIEVSKILGETENLNVSSCCKITPLMLSILSGDDACISDFLTDANIDAQTLQGNTALMLAVKKILLT